MLKFFKYFVLSIAIIFWAISHFEGLYSWSAQIGIFPDDYRYGDLYRLSLLPQFKEKAVNCSEKNVKNAKSKKVNLFILGDSFTNESKIDTSNFQALSYRYLHWDQPQSIVLDTNNKNILILQTVERSIKMHFVKPSDDIQIGNNKINDKQNIALNSFAENILNYFSKNAQKTEERLWHTIFNFDIFLFFRELKAQLDLFFFNRKSPNYQISENGDFIYYYEEADPNSLLSSFYKIENFEIDSIVNVINADMEKYKKLGFDEVILSLIPNKVSILEANSVDYNHVVERIQSHPNLQIKYIDIHSEFIKIPNLVYSKSDTHWNCYGSSIWQRKVNELIVDE